jgi:DNA-binding Lrp family transcriptional regulator
LGGERLVEAYLLFTVAIDSENQVFRDLKKLDCVQEINATFGDYDLIAKIEADSIDYLNAIINQRIRKMNNVISTLTLLHVEKLIEPQTVSLK